MFGMPTHTIYLIKEDGSKNNVCMTDCSTEKEVREEVKDLIEKYYNDQKDLYVKAQYTNSRNEIVYECTIKECMEEL